MGVDSKLSTIGHQGQRGMPPVLAQSLHGRLLVLGLVCSCGKNWARCGSSELELQSQDQETVQTCHLFWHFT